MSKKVYVTIVILTILLYVLIALQQIYVMEIGEIFGYIFWAVLTAGTITNAFMKAKMILLIFIIIRSRLLIYLFGQVRLRTGI